MLTWTVISRTLTSFHVLRFADAQPNQIHLKSLLSSPLLSYMGLHTALVFFILIKSSLSVFLFMSCAFGVKSKNSLFPPKYQRFLRKVLQVYTLY